MSRKRGGVLLLALGVTVALGVGVLVYRQAQQTAAAARLEAVAVLVAAQDIPERTLVAAPYLSVKQMLPSSLPPAALVRPEQAVGKMTTGPILAGEFILPAKLADADGRAGLSYVVPQGKVVITLPASDILTTGAIKSGDSVDLLVTIHPERANGVAATPAARGEAPAAPTATPLPADVEIGTTQMTMQNLKIVAIGSVAPISPTDPSPAEQSGQSARANPAASLITFAVDRQAALVLKALKDNQRVSLEMVLRSAGDEDEVYETDPVTLKTIMDRYQFLAVPTPVATRAPSP